MSNDNNYPAASWAAAFAGDWKHATMTSKDIVASERAGAEQAARGEIFPVEISNITKAELEEMGWEFGENDGVLYRVKIGPNFSVKRTDHNMWSRIMFKVGDGEPVEVGSMFYKAAFYDRNAFATFNADFVAGYRSSKGSSIATAEATKPTDE